MVLSVMVISTDAFLCWFNSAEAYWALLQNQECDAIVIKLKQVD